jgi:flagellar hook assembly protein FlgD
LDNINIVPNPYYAFSSYETNKLDNRVKITNLPEVCTVSIYDLNGTRIRQFKKGDPTTSLDWDLKNDQNIPIASGTYIIHVNVPNIGEKVLKWFGVMRPIDLDSF